MKSYITIAILLIATFAVADETMTLDKEGTPPKSCAMFGPGMMGGMGGMVNTDPEKAKQEMGDLYYPGATIAHSGICFMGGPESVMAMMSTTDTLDKVAAYYSGKISGNDVTSVKGPRFYSWMRPERSNDKTMMPRVKVHIAQSFSGKEVVIMVKMGECASRGRGGMGEGWMGGPMGGMMHGYMGEGMMEGDGENE